MYHDDLKKHCEKLKAELDKETSAPEDEQPTKGPSKGGKNKETQVDGGDGVGEDGTEQPTEGAGLQKDQMPDHERVSTVESVLTDDSEKEPRHDRISLVAPAEANEEERSTKKTRMEHLQSLLDMMERDLKTTLICMDSIAAERRRSLPSTTCGISSSLGTLYTSRSKIRPTKF